MIKASKIAGVIIVLVAYGLFSEAVGWHRGYGHGLQVIWTYETLGKCDAENGKTILP